MQEPKSEDQLQALFWKTVWNNYPQLRRHMWAVPNSALGQINTTQQAIQANKLKATGLLEGVFDFHIFYLGNFHIIETKFGNNGLTVDRIDKKGKKHFGQKEWGEIMVAHGATSHIYRTLAEGILIIEKILND